MLAGQAGHPQAYGTAGSCLQRSTEPQHGTRTPSRAGHFPVGPGRDAKEWEVCSCWLQERDGQKHSPDIVCRVVGLLQEDTERGLLASQGHGTLRGHLLVSVLDRLGEVECQVLCGRMERENRKTAASLQTPSLGHGTTTATRSTGKASTQRALRLRVPQPHI